MMNDHNAIAARLRRLRQSADLSQAELCRKIDCAPNRWNQYEKGDRIITLEIADRLCDLFGVTLDWIYRGDQSGLPLRLSDKLFDSAA